MQSPKPRGEWRGGLNRYFLKLPCLGLAAQPSNLLVEQPRAVLFNPRVRKGLKTDSYRTSPTD